MIRRRVSVWWVALVAAMAAVSPGDAMASGRVSLPFAINDRMHMIVPIEVNGVAASFAVVDTAATFPMIDSVTARQSGITPPLPGTPQVSILGLNGERDYPVVGIDSIRAGGFRIDAVTAAWNADLDIPGAAPTILPVSAFPGDVLEFDFAKGEMLAYDGRPVRRSTEQSDRMDYETIDGLMFVEVRINGKKGRALIDTGSNLTYVNSAFATLAKLPRDRDRTQRLLGADGDTSSIWIATARTFALSDFSIGRLELFVSDPLLFEQLGFSDAPMMVIGVDVLSQFRVQIDRPRQQIVFSMPSTRLGGLRTGSAVSGSRIGD